MLYFPQLPTGSRHPDSNPEGFRNPGEVGLPYEDLFITTEDGVRVHGWLVKQANVAAARAAPTLLYFHGNAGNIGYRLINARDLYRLGLNVLLVEYRGYGKSEGVPTEKGLMLDAEAFVRALRTDARHGVHPDRLVTFGRSLGGAVAMAAAAARPDDVAAVVAENTFLSISHMVDELMPLLKRLKPYVLKLKWDTGELAPQIKQPVLLISGAQDELVPPWHMRRLQQLLTNSAKVTFHLVPTGTHNDTWLRGGAAYYRAIANFISEVAQLKGWQFPAYSPLASAGQSNGAERRALGTCVDGEEGGFEPPDEGGVELVEQQATLPIMPQMRMGGSGRGKDE
eukprot:TRINITY_DN991_c0_g1_i14.p1 TRINITY_DN991_c0_g1~~TRINITY_DN991_c0_g1_i14.p1  ORF type:complete len:392 (+),score=135.46 TRINITY_DN991_c0_g1_i14:158-1177(+)